MTLTKFTLSLIDASEARIIVFYYRGKEDLLFSFLICGISRSIHLNFTTGVCLGEHLYSVTCPGDVKSSSLTLGNIG